MIALMRAAHLLPIIDVLRDLGTPVERELGRARLPENIKEMPNNLVGLGLAFDFVANCGHLEGVHDLGYQASQRMQIFDLSPDFLRASQTAPTIRERLQCFVRLASLDDNSVHAGLRTEGCNTRIFCNLDYQDPEVDTKQSEWLQVMALVAIIRSGAGMHWQPAEITFVSAAHPCNAALEQFGSSRILAGQKDTSITVPTAFLARRVDALQLPAGIKGSGRGPYADAGSFVETLQQAIIPYLADGYPHIDLAAEIAGTSVRTLQRQLNYQGVTFTDLLQRARFETAADMLYDADHKIIDVAMALGYEDPSNFSRAFRRFSGMSPREYRHAQTAQPLVS